MAKRSQSDCEKERLMRFHASRPEVWSLEFEVASDSNEGELGPRICVMGKIAFDAGWVAGRSRRAWGRAADRGIRATPLTLGVDQFAADDHFCGLATHHFGFVNVAVLSGRNRRAFPLCHATEARFAVCLSN